jgi:hypothetical protein
LNAITELAEVLDYLNPDELAEVDNILASELPAWVPLPGPQTQAYECEADILYYGGAAGGGKSDLLLGLALTEHQRSIIYRREGTQNLALVDRLLNELLKDRKGWNGQDHVWRGMGRQIEFGACKDAGDEQRYQGRAHDLKGFDEITHFLESQFRFLIGWLRSPVPGQRKRVVCTGNPPTSEDGQWVITFWGPWLDRNHPNPAKPGELRWFTTDPKTGKDIECPDGNPIEIDGQMVQPLSRTFIPSRVRDNVFMMSTGYESMLQALPEPLRSQMLEGDFLAGITDSAWQIFPTAWVEAAMARWTPDGAKGEMDSLGADISRGGADRTTIETRYGTWYSPIKSYPGSAVPDGATAAGLIVAELRDSAPVHVDALGVGGETVGWLESNNIQTVAVVGYDTELVEYEFDKASRSLRFRNYRALIHWRFREALDPKTGDNIALPPDPELKADLCSIMFKLTQGGILVESKEEIKKRIGRSPDKSDSVIYCSINTPKLVKTVMRILQQQQDNDNNDLLHQGLSGKGLRS